MLNKIRIGSKAYIAKGKCQGIEGIVVRADAIAKTICIEPEPGTQIITAWENIDQRLESQISFNSDWRCKCGCTETITKPHSTHGAGLYCENCGKWVRWLGKKHSAI